MTQSHPLVSLPVECCACGWRGRSRPMSLVLCPKCGGWARFKQEFKQKPRSSPISKKPVAASEAPEK